MMELTPEDKVIFSGDWHGNTIRALDAVNFAAHEGAKVIVHVGDFGIWKYDERFITALDKKLTKEDVLLYFVDGNHENFPRLYAHPVLEDGTRAITGRIFHLPRGFRWEWAGISFLALGGAPSIDKRFRREGIDWWPEEEITREDTDNAIGGGPVDIMICHDSPASAPNPICDNMLEQLKAGEYFGKGAMEDCRAHRELLREVTDEVKPLALFHGHYHTSFTKFFHHSDGSICFLTSLAHDRSDFKKNVVSVPLMALQNLKNLTRKPE